MQRTTSPTLRRQKLLPSTAASTSEVEVKHKMKTEEMFALYFRMRQDGVKENRAALATK